MEPDGRHPSAPRAASRSRTPPTPTWSSTTAAPRHLVPLRAAVCARPAVPRDARRRDFARHPPLRRLAHAKADERTGELCSSTTASAAVHALRRGRASGRRRARISPIDLPGPRLPHDMAITENYSILMDLPLVQRPGGRAPRPSQARVRPEHARPLRRDPPHGGATRCAGSRPSPATSTTSSTPGRRATTIVLDVCRVNRPEPRADLDGPLAQMLRYLRLDAHLHRYRVRPARPARTTETLLDDDNTEFPSIDTRACRAPSRYAYNMHISPASTLLFDGLLKYDTVTGARADALVRRRALGQRGPVRAARGRRARGRRLPRHLRQRRARGALGGRGPRRVRHRRRAGRRVRLPQRVPLGFHATWVRADQLRRNGT